MLRSCVQSLYSVGASRKSRRLRGQTIQLSKKLKLGLYEAKALYNYAFYHQWYSRYFLVEEYYAKAISKFTELKDDTWVAGIYQNLSAMYANMPDYVKALDANFKAIALYSKGKADEESVAACFVNVASVYAKLGQESLSIQYLEKAIKVFARYKSNNYGLALSHANIGEAYYSMGAAERSKISLAEGQQYSKSLQHLEQSLKYTDPTFTDLLGAIYKTKGLVYDAMAKKNKPCHFINWE